MSSKLGIAATIGDIDAAVDEPALRAGVLGAREAVAAELAAHTPTLTLAAAWSEVLRRSVAAAARLIAEGRPLGWTWFVSGSVARGEAIPGSDVETLIALDDGLGDEDKAEALALAADVHALLERCDVAPDANGVLASRGRFCRRRANWDESIDRWCAEPAEDRGVVMTGLLADTAAVADLGDELRSRTVEAAKRHPQARHAMLQDATAVRATIPSRLRVFATQDDTVDLKLAAVDPIVKIARWGALSAGSSEISTLQRLTDAATGRLLDTDDASILRECYVSLSRIRWRVRAGAWMKGEPVTERVSLSALAPADRATVRTVAREVSGIRRKLTYLASTSTFR
ncbi:CBS domain-containing protein [Mycobacterium sp. OAS707]|uniref:putative nucleotidyltransferase substrate binding domain-containing protein n=1 Tax=Mycobacterium sp. OAS707 TaxID=2663822 RepID=UPI0019FBA139|nr:CBS domain-containing protein [Mycobacterium sp. OAS707]